MDDLEVVTLRIEDDGRTISTPFGTVGDLEPCVLMSESVVEQTRQGTPRICPFARRLLQDGHASTEGDVMTIQARHRTLRYRLYRIEFDDGTTPPTVYLGVLQ